MSREFVNLKLGNGTRLADICEWSARPLAAGIEMTNSMQKAERAGPSVIQPSRNGLVRVRYAESQSLILLEQRAVAVRSRWAKPISKKTCPIWTAPARVRPAFVPQKRNFDLQITLSKKEFS
jgi:hypothetical protein